MNIVVLTWTLKEFAKEFFRFRKKAKNKIVFKRQFSKTGCLEISSTRKNCFYAWLFKIHNLCPGEWRWSLFLSNNISLQWKAENIAKISVWYHIWGHLQSSHLGLWVSHIVSIALLFPVWVSAFLYLQTCYLDSILHIYTKESNNLFKGKVSNNLLHIFNIQS